MFLSVAGLSSLAPFLLLCFFCCWFGFLLVDFLVVVVANEFGMKASNKKRVFEYMGTKRVIIRKKNTHDLRSFLLGPESMFKELSKPPKKRHIKEKQQNPVKIRED